jgi:membrane protein
LGVAEFFAVLKRSLIRAFQNNCFGNAKAVAFSALLSFFPSLMVVAAVVLRQDIAGVMGEISGALGRLLPPEPYRLAMQYLHAGDSGVQRLLAGAGFVALWSASGAMLSLMTGLRAAYHLPETRSILRSRLVSLLLVVAAGAPLLAATLLLFFGQQIEHRLALLWGAGSWLIFLIGGLVRWVVALATSIVVIGTVYHLAPDRPQKWGYVWPGAAVATVLWLSATLIFAWYVRTIARYNYIYGSISAVVVLMIWMYIVSLTILVGCEFTAEYERARSGKDAVAA